MKKLTLTILIAIHCSLFTPHIFSQPCLPEGITFTTQAQIDNFQTNYPNCTEIEGSVEIGTFFGEGISNLNGLNVLTSIGGYLEIARNEALISLTGLGNITSIGGDLRLIDNDVLESLTGLENLIYISGDLKIEHNDIMSSLSGLDNLTSIGGYIEICRNATLISLTGIDNIEAGSITDLTIGNNSSLMDCEINSICDYLSAPNGIVSIHNNASGCNSPGEIAIECGITLSCLPFGHYHFTTQQHIDNFQTDYPGCSDLEGDIIISGANISNLDGLNVLTSIGGNLEIVNNDTLINLSGFDNLSFIGGNLNICRNGALTSLTGLESLTEITGSVLLGRLFYSPPFLGCFGNWSLTSLDGLNNVNSIGGDLSIFCGNSLTSLTGLENLTYIGGNLKIGDGSVISNPFLITLTGLEGLTSIVGELIVSGNDTLASLSGLENITSIGGLVIYSNNTLIDLTGLDNLMTIGGGIHIESTGLSSLSGLDNLTSIGGGLGIYGNDSLTSLTGLNSVTFIGEGLSIGGLYQGGNTSLTSLIGLDNVASIGGDLNIRNNSELFICDVQSICDYLATPLGTIEIYNNAPGCNSPEEVEEACENVSIQKSNFNDSFTIFPNPVGSNTQIQYTLYQNSSISLKILDVSGREITTLVNEVQPKGEQEVIFSCAGLPAGIYFCILKTTHFTTTTKIIKLN